MAFLEEQRPAFASATGVEECGTAMTPSVTGTDQLELNCMCAGKQQFKASCGANHMACGRKKWVRDFSGKPWLSQLWPCLWARQARRPPVWPGCIPMLRRSPSSAQKRALMPGSRKPTRIGVSASSIAAARANAPRRTFRMPRRAVWTLSSSACLICAHRVQPLMPLLRPKSRFSPLIAVRSTALWSMSPPITGPCRPMCRPTC